VAGQSSGLTTEHGIFRVSAGPSYETINLKKAFRGVSHLQPEAGARRLAQSRPLLQLIEGALGRATSRITGSAPGPSFAVTRFLRFLAGVGFTLLPPNVEQAAQSRRLTLEITSSRLPAATMTDMQYDYLSEPCFNTVVDSIGRARDEQNSRSRKPTGSSELGKALQ
jgi:hypothetical protein